MKNRIDDFLKKLGMTQRELAVKSGIAESQLNVIIRTQPNVTMETALKIAIALDTTIVELFVGKPETIPKGRD